MSYFKKVLHKMKDFEGTFKQWNAKWIKMVRELRKFFLFTKEKNYFVKKNFSINVFLKNVKEFYTNISTFCKKKGRETYRIVWGYLSHKQ